MRCEKIIAIKNNKKKNNYRVWDISYDGTTVGLMIKLKAYTARTTHKQYKNRWDVYFYIGEDEIKYNIKYMKDENEKENEINIGKRDGQNFLINFFKENEIETPFGEEIHENVLTIEGIYFKDFDCEVKQIFEKYDYLINSEIGLIHEQFKKGYGLIENKREIREYIEKLKKLREEN